MMSWVIIFAAGKFCLEKPPLDEWYSQFWDEDGHCVLKREMQFLISCPDLGKN
jgi:hypothetical protein